MVTDKQRDIIILGGGIIVLYIFARTAHVEEVWNFYYTMLMFMAIIMMNTMHVIMYKRFNTDNDTTYRIAAIMFNFESINMLLGFIVNMIDSREPAAYIMIICECNLIELLCIPLCLKYVEKKINKDKIASIVAMYFFMATFISRGIYIYFGMKVYQVLMNFVACILLFSNVIGVYLTKEYKWRLSEKGVRYLNLYWGTRSVYHLLGIYQSINSRGPYAIIIRCVLMYIKFISIYYVLISLYYNCIEKSWNQLVEQLRTTNEKIYSNNQDRDTIVNLSHELKTPLNVIQSATQILRLDTKMDKSITKDLLNIRYECNEAMKLITNMIDINKLKGDYLKPKFENSNIVEVIENVVEAFVMEYEDASLIFNTNEEEVNLEVDINLIQRIGVYIIGTMLNLGRKNVYVDVEYIDRTQSVNVRIYIEEICHFIKKHQKDVANCKTEEVGDMLALEFTKRILELHHAKVTYENGGCLRITFSGASQIEEEVGYLEDNITYLREQVRSSYHVC